MNIILIKKEDFISKNTIRISDSRLLHIRNVLKIQKGDSIQTGIINGSIGEAILLEREEHADLFSINCSAPPPPPVPVTLVLALPRPKVLRRILQSITTMGIKKIIIINTYRVEKSYWQTPFLSETALHEQLISGLQQAKDTVLPEIQTEKRFRPFVEDRLPLILQDKKGYIAHPYTDSSLSICHNKASVLAIGPEGGFIPFEINLLEKAGMSSFSMGHRILKVETAVPVLVSRFLSF
ncbi:16S rRNA (uracil(1498)-N(3))-methyltransferase [Desulfobotulus mexicanus]|uniref:Ribosomal RNA small subunit methyltransferase E n=1 Tax=Desulfobotulus mexicanus TaxID=2586642 RepID=A0A5S5MEN6_9BACT|nr:16S rRNA (uracil(1498)-N(3))-methyltransferase [Desulfobotulus mexicanus]TYT74160.1 16S rRNA (uracil(1498)-N(3))-methyltransferase [Desulfobotulus mexicanus]